MSDGGKTRKVKAVKRRPRALGLLESSTLDERDRVLIIAAALLIDRVFHTGEKD